MSVTFFVFVGADLSANRHAIAVETAPTMLFL